jgi:hypothetical protein
MSDKIGQRELDLARKWHKQGLLSAEWLKAIEERVSESDRQKQEVAVFALTDQFRGC